MSLLGGVIGAAGGALGSIAGGAISSAISYINNKKQLEFARDVLDTQVRMSNTAHRREVKDLRAAGLNPILSAHGSGSSGVSPVSYNPDRGDGLGRGVQQAADLFFTAKNAETQRLAAETQAWSIVDAKDVGRTGFEVLGFGTGGKWETVQTIRINKVTGECYTLDGRRVQVKDQSVPGGEVTVSFDQPHSAYDSSLHSAIRKLNDTLDKQNETVRKQYHGWNPLGVH